MIDRIRKNRIWAFLSGLCLAGLLLFLDRTLRDNFFFRCTYRMQFIAKWAPVVLAWVVFAAFFVFLAKRIRSHTFDAGEYTVLFFYLAIYGGYLIPTVLYGACLPRWLDALLYSLPPFLLASMAFSREDTTKLFLRSGTLLFTFMALANALFALFPGLWTMLSEWRDEFLLGFHTLVSWPLVLGMLFALMDSRLSGRKWPLVLYSLLFFLNAFLVRAGGFLIGSAIIAVWLVFPFVRRIFEKWHFLIFLALVVVLLLVLMFALEPVTNFPPVTAFLKAAFNRDPTLSGRLYIWSLVKDLAAAHPVFGQGMGESAVLVFEPSHWNEAWVHAHNVYLQTACEGGLVTLLLAFSMLITFSFRKPDGLVKMILFAVLVMLLNDQDSYYPWYLVAFICHLGVCYGKEKPTANRDA